jgi:hypothetical protein
MPLVQPMPVPRFQFFDDNGDPVANGFLYTYAAGTNTPLATYNDHTGNPGALNPNPVQLDSGGYADVWLTAASYKLVLQDSNHVQIWSIDGVPGLGSLISVGDLPPLFTSVFAAGGLSFVLDNAAANTLFGRFAGTTGAPSYGAVGSDKQVTFNKSGGMVGNAGLLFDDALNKLTVGGSVQIFVDGGGPKIILSNASQPLLFDASGTGFFITSQNNQDFRIGPANDVDAFILSSGAGGSFSLPPGTMRIGTGANKGTLYLNDATSAAGMFLGAKIICGALASPETFIDAPTGSLYITTMGGAGTTLWVKESSPTTNTGWIGK